MKLDYFYDGQVKRVLSHIIRMFSEFQVQSGFDDDGNPKFRKVPCRYADMSRQALQLINGASENVANYAPIMTVSIQSLKMERENVRSPVHQDTIIGTNVSPAYNSYTDQLDEQYHVRRHNPVPWELVFDVNIWATTMVNKMELWEQIATVFAPSVTLKISTNPLDWTAEERVELIAANFTSRSIPQGTTDDLDIATMSFKTTIWMSLPATVKKASIIEQINTSISLGKDEMDIELGSVQDIASDVYTPNNLQVRVTRNSSNANVEQYQAELLSYSGLNTGPGGGLLSWQTYLDYLRPQWEDKGAYLKLNSVLEDANPVRGTIISIDTEDDANKLVFEVDTTSYNVQYTVDEFCLDAKSVRAGDGKKYIATDDMTIQNIAVPKNAIFESTKNGVNIVPSTEYTGVVYISAQGTYFSYSSSIGWYETVLKNYKPGLWKIALIR